LFVFFCLFVLFVCFKGGPFYCAMDTIVGALTACTSDPFLLDVNLLVSKAKQFAQSGQIDGLGNLSTTKVFLFSGTGDTVVNPEVVKKVESERKKRKEKKRNLF
jgi:hypothetical protein